MSLVCENSSRPRSAASNPENTQPHKLKAHCNRFTESIVNSSLMELTLSRKFGILQALLKSSPAAVGANVKPFMAEINSLTVKTLSSTQRTMPRKSALFLFILFGLVAHCHHRAESLRGRCPRRRIYSLRNGRYSKRPRFLSGQRLQRPPKIRLCFSPMENLWPL